MYKLYITSSRKTVRLCSLRGLHRRECTPEGPSSILTQTLWDMLQGKKKERERSGGLVKSVVEQIAPNRASAEQDKCVLNSAHYLRTANAMLLNRYLCYNLHDGSQCHGL